MLLDSMTYMMVTVVRLPSSNPVNRISWLLLPDRQDESDRSMSTMPSELRGWTLGNSRRTFGRTLRSSFLRRKRKKTKTLIWYVLSPHEICRFLTRFPYFQQQDEEATDPAEARVFTNVITGLHRNYPKDKLEEISTSFCFICLLHLANEQGLKLETGTEEHDAADEKRVGNIWDLKVRTSQSSTEICSSLYV